MSNKLGLSDWACTAFAIGGMVLLLYVIAMIFQDYREGGDIERHRQEVKEMHDESVSGGM